MKIKFILTLVVGLSLALTMPGCSPARPASIPKEEPSPQAKRAVVAAHPEVPRITAQELKQLMDKKGEYILVDTRDSYSYDHGHIKGAVNIYNDPEGDPYPRKMMLRALPRDKLIILYCD
jgi:3-mercaptopyruvate sulfurtransferase SseA